MKYLVVLRSNIISKSYKNLIKDNFTSSISVSSKTLDFFILSLSTDAWVFSLGFLRGGDGIVKEAIDVTKGINETTEGFLM